MGGIVPVVSSYVNINIRSTFMLCVLYSNINMCAFGISANNRYSIGSVASVPIGTKVKEVVCPDAYPRQPKWTPIYSRTIRF